MNLKNKNFYIILFAVAFFTLLSFYSFLYPLLNSIVFVLIILGVLIIGVIDLKAALVVAFIELFIGSKGYLFSFDLFGQNLSIRIGIWIIIMSVYFSRSISEFIKTKKISIDLRSSDFFLLYLGLFASILWGLANGFLRHNQLNDLFFDFNGWLYLSYIIPVYSLMNSKDSEQFKKLIIVALRSSVLWLSIFTLLTFYVFEHNLVDIMLPIYQWYKKIGIGEITRTESGFHRVFIQSQIFSFAAYFAILLENKINIKDHFSKNNLSSMAYFVLISSCLLLSFSRSFWFGLVFGYLFLLILLVVKRTKLKEYIGKIIFILIFTFASLILLIAVAKFPYPRSYADYNAFDLITERAQQVSGEAGASSRWALLPELAKKIKKDPVLGNGYGSTVTYKTSDPRILENDPTGSYTTYAFEWGWLDIWLKLGLVGLLIYLGLIFKVYFKSFAAIKQGEVWPASLSICLMTVCFVSIFSPYTNHPLGLGLLLITTFFIDTGKIKKII